MNTTLIYTIIGYLILMGLVYLIQERFIFKPEKLKQNIPYNVDELFKKWGLKNQEYYLILGRFVPENNSSNIQKC